MGDVNNSSKGVLSVGLLCFGGAALVAALSPANEYEISIFLETPLLFWVFIGGTLGVGIVGGMFLSTHQQRLSAATLALFAVTFIAALPFVRQYYFYGQADSLQHLGWAIDIIQLGPTALDRNPYPGLHLLAVFFTELLGLSLRRAFLFAMPVLFLLFALSTALLAREFTEQRDTSITIGFLFATLTTPIIAVRLPNFQPIATVSGLFVLLFVVFVAVRATRTFDVEGLFGVLLVSTAALIVYHPQQGLVGIVLISLFVLTKSYPKILTHHYTRPLTAVVIGSVILGYWLATRRVFAGAISNLIVGLLAAQGGVSAATPGSAFQEIGGSIVTLFVRSVGVQIVISVIVAGLILTSTIRLLRSYFEHTGKVSERDTVRVRYVIGFAAPILFAMLNLASGNIPQVVRYVAALVALGAPLVIAWFACKQSQYDRRSVTVVLTILLLIGAAVSIPAMFRSPYIYQPAPHVTENQLDGYDWAFQYRNNQSVMSVNTDVGRQLLALRGFEQGNRQWGSGSLRTLGDGFRGEGFVSAHFNGQNLGNLSSSSWLLTSTDYAYERNVVLYKGLRFNNADYHYLETNTDRVYSNGGYQLHRVRINVSG